MCIEHNLVIRFFSRCFTEDKKLRKDTVRGRTAIEMNLGLMSSIVESARSRFSSLMHHEAKTATVGSSQPEFMHNLVFQ